MHRTEPQPENVLETVEPIRAAPAAGCLLMLWAGPSYVTLPGARHFLVLKGLLLALQMTK